MGQRDAGAPAGRCGGDGLLQHRGLYNWLGTSAPGAGAVAVTSSRAGRGMPRQAVQKSLPPSVPLPLMARGFAALSDSVKGGRPLCVSHTPHGATGALRWPVPLPRLFRRLRSVWL